MIDRQDGQPMMLPFDAGYLIHDHCWLILLAVHFRQNPDQPLSVSRLGDLMRQHWERTCVNWSNDMYEGAGLYQDDEWEPIPGLEVRSIPDTSCMSIVA